MTELDAPHQRADARRNRAALLAAASALLADRGLAVQVEDVASEAGVGVATIYRHFGSRDALIREVLASRTVELIEAVRRAVDGVAPGDALRRTITTIVDVLASERGLVDAAIRFRALHAEPDASYVELVETTARVLAAAQDAGATRPDIRVDDLTSLIMGAGMMAPDAASRRRVCEVVFAGLQVRSELGSDPS